MAFTNAETRYFLGVLPEADSAFSAGDVGLFLHTYMFGSHVSRSLGGSFTPTGALSRALTAYRNLDGSFRSRLPGWTHAMRIDIDYAGCIGSPVTHFPVTIFLNNNNDTHKVFDEIGANKQKLAVTKSDGLTELYVEVDYWNATTKEGVLHVSKSDWVIGADTNVWLYFDSAHANNTTYVGIVPGASPAINVWDANFMMVQHMNDSDTSHTLDSTSNNNDGTKKGANEPIEAAGKVGYAQDFDGSDDFIKILDAASLDMGTNDFTISLLIKRSGISSATERFFIKRVNSGTINWYDMYLESDNILYPNMALDFPSLYRTFPPTSTIADLSWHSVVITIDRDGNGITYLDDVAGTPVDISALTGDLSSSADLNLGAYGISTNVPFTHWFHGLIDEFRISNIARSAAWRKAEYNSVNDVLLTYGSMETFIDGGGGLSGVLSRLLTAYRGFGGSFTPTGNLLSILTMVIALGGELDFIGEMSWRNPSWLLLDETLRWMGEWDSAYGYSINDTVLYKTTDGEWHVFVSKAGHNVGNIPTSSAAWWRRLYQEQWV